ncbi:EAL domain-containing protein [Eoetvoesiella caeni]
MLVPALQKIMSADNGQVVGYEALARWTDLDKTLTPSECIPNWKRTDIEMMSMLTDCEFHKSIDTNFLFINVSPHTLACAKSFELWLDALGELSKQLPGQCVVEITEQVPDALLKARWKTIQSQKVGLALDDFGDGHSQFSRLHRHDWDYCKFNAVRLSNLMDAGALVYCQNSGIRTIVERVETEHQRYMAQLVGMEWQQGFYYNEPTLITEFMEAAQA